MNRTMIAILFVAAPTTSVAAADVSPSEAQTLTLQQAMRRALELNPQALSARAEVEAAEAQRRFFRSAILPQIEFSGNSTANMEDVSIEFEGERFTILPRNDWSYSVTLSQPVFAGGREMKTIRQAGLTIESAKAGLSRTEDQLLLQTATAYLAAVEGQALVEVEQKNLELAERRRKQARDFFEAGEVTQVDVLRADTAVKGAERRLAAATQARDVALSNLRVTLAADQPIAVEPPRLAFPALPADEDLMERAQAWRPEVRQAMFNRRSAEIEVSKQRAFRLPVVTAEATARTQRADFPTDQMGSLTLNVSVPIFDSGAIGSRVAIATERKKQAEYGVEQTQRQVREDVRQALIALHFSETNLALARDQLTAAEAEYSQTFELYRAQEVTSLDVSVAESTLAESRRAVVQGQLDRDLAELRIWYAVGSMKTVLMTEGQP